MLVTWIEGGAYVTKRYEGVTAVNTNWTNDANWTKLISEVDTLTYTIYSDTSNYSYIAQLAYDADTSTFAWYADTANYSNSSLDCDDIHAYIDASLYGTEINCNNIILSLTGSSNQSSVTYQWDGSISGDLGTSNPLIAAIAETVTLTVTNSVTGCEDTAFVVLTNNTTDPTLEKFISSKNINDELVLGVFVTNQDADAEYSYSWTGTGITTSASAQSIKVNASGNFTATVTNENNGCDDDAIVSVDTSFFDVIADTSNYALYSDTSNVALNVNVDSVYLNGINDENHVPGSLIYDTLTQSLIFHNDLPDFHHNIGYEIIVRVYNESGSQIDNGTVVTLDTIYQDGLPMPTVKKAGKASIDSLVPVGMATVDIPDNDYGIVTIIGIVNDLNTSGYGIEPSEPIYVSNNGEIQGTKPEPPDYALLLGYMLRVDNDSGSIYIMPEVPVLQPEPNFISDTSSVSQVVTINTQDVYEYIPLNLSQVRENKGFIQVGDSVQVLLSANYDLILGMSFQGNPTSEVWRYGIFIDGKPQFTKSRNTTSSSTGDINVISYRYIDAGQWVSWKIKNESGTGDPTIVDMNYQINFRHE
jgi:hypothetical protein